MSVKSIIVTKVSSKNPYDIGNINKSYASIITSTNKVKNSAGLIQWLFGERVKNNLPLDDFLELINKYSDQIKNHYNHTPHYYPKVSFHIQDRSEPIQVKIGKYNTRSSRQATNQNVFTLAPNDDRFGTIEISLPKLHELLQNSVIKDGVVIKPKLHFNHNHWLTIEDYNEIVEKQVTKQNKLNSIQKTKNNSKKIPKDQLIDGCRIDVIGKEFDTEKYNYYYFGYYTNLLAFSEYVDDKRKPYSFELENFKSYDVKKYVILQIDKSNKNNQKYIIKGTYPYITKIYEDLIQTKDIIDLKYNGKWLTTTSKLRNNTYSPNNSKSYYNFRYLSKNPISKYSLKVYGGLKGEYFNNISSVKKTNKIYYNIKDAARVDGFLNYKLNDSDLNLIVSKDYPLSEKQVLDFIAKDRSNYYCSVYGNVDKFNQYKVELILNSNTILETFYVFSGCYIYK